jgi:hypothetical protein
MLADLTLPRHPTSADIFSDNRMTTPEIAGIDLIGF